MRLGLIDRGKRLISATTRVGTEADNQFMRMIERKFSGWLFNLPKDFRLVAVKITQHERIEKELKDDYFGVEYWMRLKNKDIFKEVFCGDVIQ